MISIVSVIKVFLNKIIINNLIQNVYVEAKYYILYFTEHIFTSKN